MPAAVLTHGLILPYEVCSSTSQRDLFAAKLLKFKRCDQVGGQREVSIESCIQQAFNLTVPTIRHLYGTRYDDFSIRRNATNRCHDDLLSLNLRLAPR
jgi:hypothetical protein